MDLIVTVNNLTASRHSSLRCHLSHTTTEKCNINKKVHFSLDGRMSSGL